MAHTTKMTNRHPVKSFLLTVYNINKENFNTLIKPLITRATYQIEECPQTKKQHIQAFIQTKEKYTITQLKKKLNTNDIHIETCKNCIQAQQYCSKDETRIEGPYQIGEPYKDKTQTWILLAKYIKEGDINKIKEDLLPLYTRYKHSITEQIIEANPPKTVNHLRGIYISGPAGCGKSSYVHTLQPYYKLQNKWWDGYFNEEIVVMEDIDNTTLQWATHFIKIWTDHYPTRGEKKGSTVNLQHEWFILTSNHRLSDLIKELHPEDQKAIFRRFHVFEFNNQDNTEQIEEINKLIKRNK